MAGYKSNLGDPQWEIIDPTPNIHALFIQFDARFFWGKLSSVVVRWSKRMYSCAGICRYEGRGGLCDVALSEPLLKLRPRKDVVETLLHEMIHAYLFLSNGDRDRDGHGPNFCHHMRRINKEANINITIYHTFHEEVKHYQTHWWRCNGPCQQRKPFFGMVRRTANRRPGPNDFWWKSHQLSCNGTFIKVREPEKTVKQNKKEQPASSSKGNITKYINMGSPKMKAVPLPPPMTPKQPKLNTSVSPKNTLINMWNKPKSPQSASNSSEVLNIVRNHWAEKDLSGPSKRKQSDQEPVKSSSPIAKIIKIESDTEMVVIDRTDINSMLINIYGEIDIDKVKMKPPLNNNIPHDHNVSMVHCPLCNMSIKSIYINEHLDKCLGNTDEPVTKTEEQVIDLTSENSKQNSKCPICNKSINTSLNDHIEDCLSGFNNEEDEPIEGSFVSPSSGSNADETIDDDDLDETAEFNSTGTKFPCPCCLQMIEQEMMNTHLDLCLA